MTPGARLKAVIDILGEVAGASQPVDRYLRDWGRANRYAGSKDRAAIAERVYAILRRRSSLAWRMGSDGARALVIASALDENVEALFIGGYAPQPLSDAERAAIAAQPTGGAPPHVEGEYPLFLEPELRRAFAERLPDEMRALQLRAPVDLRVNTLKTTREAMLARLGGEPTPRSPWGIRLPPGTTGLQPCAEYEFQDEASQVAALMCEARPGMRVLDLAAGAGGKSLALAAAMENEGEIVADDVRANALIELERRAVRAGVTIIQTQLPLPHMRGGEGGSYDFDIVLVDAPCSGTGTWRRQPELRWRLTPERLSELMAIQDALLTRAATHVRPGGRLVYATCSILPCENEDRIAGFCGLHPQFAITGSEFRASPHSTGTDGFFAVVLARRA
jgi:16S rRNA (cytosine967-C5)-methyltransferase